MSFQKIPNFPKSNVLEVIQNLVNPALFLNSEQIGVKPPGTVPALGLLLSGTADPALPFTGPKGAMAEGKNCRDRVSLVDKKEILSPDTTSLRTHLPEMREVHGPEKPSKTALTLKKGVANLHTEADLSTGLVNLCIQERFSPPAGALKGLEP